MRSGSDKGKDGQEMKTNIMMALALLSPAVVLAAGPVAKSDPVADGYPDWQGVTAKNFILGREICPSDLRHKVAVVVDVEPNDKLQSQLVLAAKFVQRVGLPTGWGGESWETLEFPRDIVVVIANRGGGRDKDHEAIKAALKYKGDDANISSALLQYRSMACSIYDDVTFPGAPDSAGKRPFVYVMGPEGKDPVFQGELAADKVKAVNAAITKSKKQISEGEVKWRPFYGTVAEPKFFPQLAKALEKGKPLAPIEKALLKDVVSKDPDKAKEAQVLYDAVCQTRSDLVARIQAEVRDCPHRAYYDIQQLVKYWPAEKKRLEKVFAELKSVPEAEKLAKIFVKLKTWTDPDFTCKNAGEAKKIVAELNKMKKDCTKMQNSQSQAVQNGAALMESLADDLILNIPSKVQVP